MREEEFGEMIEAIRDADKNRDTLTATAGRASARHSIDEADDLFSQLDRIGDEIGADDARREASSELDDLLDDRRDRLENGPDLEEIDVDARLEACATQAGIGPGQAESQEEAQDTFRAPRRRFRRRRVRFGGAFTPVYPERLWRRCLFSRVGPLLGDAERVDQRPTDRRAHRVRGSW